MGYQSIYNQLRANGLTEAGALGMLGNFDCESNCIAYRLQGDYSYPYNASKQYTADVDSGRISRQQFSRDSKGYGLAQWTYWTRKENLWDFWRARGGSIGDERLQVDFAVHELSTEGEYGELWTLLKTTNDVYTATDHICRKFERPYYNNVDQRFAAAKRIQGEIDLDGGGDEPEPEPSPAPDPGPDTPTTPFWPPRVLCEGMQGSDVSVLQALLQAHGYNISITGIFDNRTKAMVLAFQGENGLATDGIAGPKTFGALGVSA